MTNLHGVLSTAVAYIEGVRVPILSWQTQAGVNGAASCVISVNPSPGARRLLPGSHIVVATADTVRLGSPEQEVGRPYDADSRRDARQLLSATEHIDHESQRGFYVAFEGRLIARGFQVHSSGMRAVTLSCKGVLLDWEQTKQYWGDPSASPGEMINTLLINNFSGAEAKWDPMGGSLQSWILAGMKKGDIKVKGPKPKENEDDPDETEEEENFLEHILNIVENFGNTSAFYSTNRSRFRLTDRVTSIPTGASMKQLFAVNAFAGFYRGTLQKLTGMSTLMNLVAIMLEVIHHDVVEIGAPSLVWRAGVDRQDNGLAKADPDSGVFTRKFGREEMIPTSVIIKPQIYEAAPPSCNVIFPDVRMELSYQRTFAGEPSRQQAMPTVAFFEEGKFQGIKKMQPEILAAFCNHKIAGNAIGSKKKKGASTSDGEQPDGDVQELRDWHFLTNEEKFRGIVYNHIQSFPTPGKLAKTEAVDEDHDNINEYIDLILRAQFLKSRYQSRGLTCSGPLNLRPVPGFPVLILDDSGAEMDMLGYLMNVTHSQDAQGSDMTSYEIAFPREIAEENLNAPVRVRSQEPDDGTGEVEGTRTVTVVKGDTLNEIGAKYGLAPRDIAALNPQLLGRAYTHKKEHIPSDYSEERHGKAYLTDYDYIIPGDEIIILPLAPVEGAASTAENAKERLPIKTRASEFGVQEFVFKEVKQPEVPAWFANPWRDRGDVPAALSRAYRTLLGWPVIACTHPGDNNEFDTSVSPVSIVDAVTKLKADLKSAAAGGIRAEFVDRYTRRRLVTVGELFYFLEAQPISGADIYTGGPFEGAEKNFPFEVEKWDELIDGVEELVRKGEASAEASEDPKQRQDINEAKRVMSALRSGDLSYPMTFKEVYDARRQRAINYYLELTRKQGYRG